MPPTLARSSAAKVASLRRSILEWAFEGRLVDQDPTDEPASVLLERIRVEGEASVAKAKWSSPDTLRLGIA